MKIRPYEEARDRALFEQWMHDDPFHQHTCPEAWLRPEGRMFNVLCDDEGEAIIFLSFEKVLRMNCQFNPAKTRENVKRTGDGLKFLNVWIREIARKEGFRSVIFNSISERLIKFCHRHLNFWPAAHEFIKQL